MAEDTLLRLLEDLRAQYTAATATEINVVTGPTEGKSGRTTIGTGMVVDQILSTARIRRVVVGSRRLGEAMSGVGGGVGVMQGSELGEEEVLVVVEQVADGISLYRRLRLRRLHSPPRSSSQG